MTGNLTDVALSSRIRLARNIEGYPFPNAMEPGQLQELIGRVNAAINSNEDFMLVHMRGLPAQERRLLVERHLISPALAGNDDGAVLVNRDETVSIMIGEEDHLRIQCLQPGLQLEQADALSASIDNMLSSKLPYVFDAELGYLTACPTNVGSGMRASVMLHLPALSLAGQVEPLLKEVGKLGYAVRGLYGEGSGAPGHIYQVSNQMTLGLLEEDIISNLHAMVQRIVAQERAVRDSLYHNNKAELEDLVFRSYGLLQYARKLNTGEAMEHISNLRLGRGLGIVKEQADTLSKLLTDVQPASLEKMRGGALGEQQRDMARAQLMREAVKEMEIKN